MESRRQQSRTVGRTFEIEAMDETRRYDFVICLVMLCVLLFLTLYCSAYFATANRVFKYGVGVNDPIDRTLYLASYGQHHGVLVKIFAPVHWIDRKLRLSFWSPPRFAGQQ